MPNWCYTTYKILGNKESVEPIHEMLNELKDMEKPLVENGFGNLWLGCIIERLGGDWQKIGCRGSVEDYYISDDRTELTINTETAWAECNEFRKFLEDTVPGIKIYYISEESEMEDYYTNDKDYKVFHTKYFLDTCDMEFEPEYFETEQELVDFLNSKGFKCHDEESAGDAIVKFMDEHEDEDNYIALHEYEIIDDE